MPRHTKQRRSTPRHVGLIVDGVRRWARARDIPLLDAYTTAMERVRDFIEYFFRNESQCLSVYLLSTDNLRRPPDELNPVFQAEADLVSDGLPPMIRRWGCKVRHAGDIHLLPESFASALLRLTTAATGNARVLNLLIAYSPRDELVAATRTSADLHSALWVPEPVDLLIRTSGERRLSGFLPLQCAYAELFFSRKPINDFKTADFRRSLSWYRSRHRRFGA